MLRWLRRIAIGTALVLLGAGVAIGLLYRAVTAPVPAYQALVDQTRQLDSEELDQNRQELESQLAALYSDATNEPTWQTVVTAKQMNGWLATELEAFYPDLAEQGVIEPRVMITPQAITLATRAKMHGIDAVVSLDLAPMVAEDGSLALELAAARIGSAPLPTAQIFAQLQMAAGEEGLPGRWSQNDGRPVLVVDVSWAAPTVRHESSLETIELREGEIYLAGRTEEVAPRVAQLEE